MFEEIREAFHDLLHGNVPPDQRRDLLRVMRDSIAHARLAVEDLREGLATTN